MTGEPAKFTIWIIPDGKGCDESKLRWRFLVADSKGNPVDLPNGPDKGGGTTYPTRQEARLAALHDLREKATIEGDPEFRMAADDDISKIRKGAS